VIAHSSLRLVFYRGRRWKSTPLQVLCGGGSPPPGCATWKQSFTNKIHKNQCYSRPPRDGKIILVTAPIVNFRGSPTPKILC